ncbi:MAG TPA: hypothetical protein VKF16_05920 [Candidatus Dormibacteraeota bacterium]|nr:hypothetical protein [Candidatus Dormibacteraeota bacterium]
MKRLLFGSIASGVIALAALSAGLIPASAGAEMNSGFYDHQIIQYEATAEVTSSPQAAQLISKGNVVYHVVAPDGSTPAVQCARLIAALPNVGSSCNVLNFIPTEVGYEGGAWNLQIFHWAPGVTTVELSKDDDILAAVAAGRGTLEVTNILVRCPVVNFAALR